MSSNLDTVTKLQQAAKKGYSRLQILRDIVKTIGKDKPISICTLPGDVWALDQMLIKEGFQLANIDGIEKDIEIFAQSINKMDELQTIYPKSKWRLFKGEDTTFFNQRLFHPNGYSFIWLDWMGTFTTAYANMLIFIAENVEAIFKEALSNNTDAAITVVFARKSTNREIDDALIEAFIAQGLTLPNFSEKGTENASTYRLQGVSLLLNQYARQKAYFIPMSYNYYKSAGSNKNKAMLSATFRVTKAQPINVPILYNCVEISE